MLAEVEALQAKQNAGYGDLGSIYGKVAATRGITSGALQNKLSAVKRRRSVVEQTAAVAVYAALDEIRALYDNCVLELTPEKRHTLVASRLNLTVGTVRRLDEARGRQSKSHSLKSHKSRPI
jgi:hypothetical protein